MTWDIAANENVISVDTNGQEVSRHSAVVFTDEGVMGERCSCELVASTALGTIGHSIVSEVRRTDPRSNLTMHKTGFKIRLRPDADIAKMCETVQRLSEEHATSTAPKEPALH